MPYPCTSNVCAEQKRFAARDRKDAVTCALILGGIVGGFAVAILEALVRMR